MQRNIRCPFRSNRNPPVQGALVAIDPSTGDVKALVGGYDFEESKFDRATQAMRQTGSVFKPFVYTAAVDRGVEARRHRRGCSGQLRRLFSGQL